MTLIEIDGHPTGCNSGNLGVKAATTAMATKTLLENKHLVNGEYFVIIASSSHPLLLTEHAANGLVEAPLNKNRERKIYCCVSTLSLKP